MCDKTAQAVKGVHRTVNVVVCIAWSEGGVHNLVRKGHKEVKMNVLLCKVNWLCQCQ